MAETRITGGEWRGRQIPTPGGLAVRPTRGMVRQALFNILGPAIAGARVVDLYAGAGTVGFEALSRGAERVTFVERHQRTIAVIAAGTRRFDCEDRVDLVRAEVLSWLRRRPTAVTASSLCFLDAPYRDDEMLTALSLLADLAPPLIVCEHHRARSMPARLGGLQAVRTANYGLTDLTIFRRPQPDPGSR